MRKFSGTALECLNHLAKNYWPAKGSKEIRTAQKSMSDFVGVTTNSITRWTSGIGEPLGEPLNKLRFFLEVSGYDVTELKSISGTVNYMLAELHAFGLLTVQQSLTELEYGNVNSIFRLIHGVTKASEVREQKIREMHEIFQKELAQAREKLKIIISESTSAKPEPDTDSEKKVEPVSGPALRMSVPVLVGSSAEQELIEVTAKLVMAVTPLLERLVKSWNKEDRNKLRHLVGDTGMFRLSKASSRLCSEKAREIVRD